MSEDISLGPDALEHFRDYLLLLARARIGPKYRSRIDPEELVNETLFEAGRQREQFRGSTQAELVSWLKRMLQDNAADAVKFQHRDKRDIDRELAKTAADWDQSCSQLFDISCGLTSPSMKAVKHERELALARALASLPEAQREAIELHHLHGLSLDETAESLGRTPASVVGLLRRGRKSLREMLQETLSKCP